jgi:hypothetical protein
MQFFVIQKGFITSVEPQLMTYSKNHRLSGGSYDNRFNLKVIGFYGPIKKLAFQVGNYLQ